MPKSAGSLVIDLSLGQAQFVQGLVAAKAQVRDFGTHTVSSMQASSAAIREAMGGSNIRAVEKFISTIPGVSTALQAAFPIIGAVALAGVLTEMITKAYDFVRAMQNAPEKIAGAFREINAPLKLTNDELALANARLESDIAKLEGSRQNTLAIALRQAAIEADKLAKSLDSDIQAMNKLLKQEEIGQFKAFFTGSAATSDITKYFGGETGYGGYERDIADINRQAQAKIDAAIKSRDAGAQENAVRDRNVLLLDRQKAALSFINSELQKQRDLSKSPGNVTIAGDDGIGQSIPIAGQPVDQRRFELLQEMRNRIQEEMKTAPLSTEHSKLTANFDDLKAQNSNAKLDRPFDTAIGRINAEIDDLKLKLTAVGAPDSAKAIVAGYGEALKEIQKVNEEMKRQNPRSAGVTGPERGQLIKADITKAQTAAEIAYQSKVTEGNLAIRQRIESLRQLNAAIGQGYESTKRANVETQLMSEFKENYADPTRAGDVGARRNQLGQAFDEQNRGEILKANDALANQIELERSLAAVQSLGAVAVDRVTLAYRLRSLAQEKGLANVQEEIAKEIALFEAQKLTASAGQVAELNLQIDAQKRLADAELQGAEAVRRQALENKYAQMAKASPLGAKDPAIDLERQKDGIENISQIRSAAIASGIAYKNNLDALLRQRDALAAIKDGEMDANSLAIARKANEDAILKAMVDQALALGRAQDGVRAFFLQMQQQAITSGKIIYDALNSAVDGVSSNIAKLGTGQKSDFGKTFKNIGNQLTEQAVKKQIESVIGDIGKKLGIKPPVKKPLGTPNDRIYVSAIIEGANAAANGGSLPPGYPGGFPGRDPLNIPGIGGIGSVGGGDGGVFGGALGGGIYSLLGDGVGATSGPGSPFGSAISSIAFGGFDDDGGPVAPGERYTVGERGEEDFVPSVPGNIVPNNSRGGGGNTYYVNNDNRGTDPAVTDQRMRAGMEATHNSAVGTAARVVIEQQKRSVQ